MMKALLFILILFIGTSLVASCTSPRRGPARGDPPNGSMMGRGMDMPSGYVARPVAVLLTGFDSDHDQRISRAELTTGIQKEWRQANLHATDKLSATDIQVWQTAALGSSDALPNRLSFDTNLDSFVTEAEFIAGLTREFNELDANKDGDLSRGELIFELPRMQMRGGTGGRGGGPGPGSGERPPPR